MTDTTRADFEVFITPKIHADYKLTKALHCFENGEYENDLIQAAWLSYETGALAAYERCERICQAQADAAKKARNTQYQIGCIECLDEIRSGK